MSTIRKHHVNVVATDDTWRRLKAAAALEGAELGDLLGWLVCDHLGIKRHGTALTPIPGQLPLDDAPKPSRRRAPRSSSTSKQVTPPPAKRRRGAPKP